MKAYVINLARESGRMAFQTDQAARAGLMLERIEAVTTDALHPPAGDPAWSRWQRPLRDVEKATLLSHAIVWRKIAATDRPALVLEDDAWLMPRAGGVLAAVAGLSGIDHLSLETRGRRKVLGPRHAACPGIRRLWLDRSGAAAYVLWPEGARRMLAQAARVPALADAVPVETPGLRRWQADPAQAIQIDMADRYGLTPPIPVASAISSVERPHRGGVEFRLRRLWHQAAMGVSGLKTLAGAERREVQPDLAAGRLR